MSSQDSKSNTAKKKAVVDGEEAPTGPTTTNQALQDQVRRSMIVPEERTPPINLTHTNQEVAERGTAMATTSPAFKDQARSSAGQRVLVPPADATPFKDEDPSFLVFKDQVRDYQVVGKDDRIGDENDNEDDAIMKPEEAVKDVGPTYKDQVRVISPNHQPEPPPSSMTGNFEPEQHGDPQDCSILFADARVLENTTTAPAAADNVVMMAQVLNEQLELKERKLELRVQRRRFLVAGTLVLITVVGAIVGGICGAGYCGNREPEIILVDGPTDAPTTNPFNISYTIAPTQNSTFTTFPPDPIPLNDICEESELLESGKMIVGTTLGASPGPDSHSYCGDAVPPLSPLGSPEVWYRFVGTGGNHTITTCTGFYSLDNTGFDSQLIVYSGTCDNLTCVTGNDDNYATTCGEANAALSLTTKLNVTYYILVFDYYGLEGDFGIKIEDGITFETFPRPDNDFCESATVLELDQIIEGTTSGATATTNFRNAICGDAYDSGKYIPDVFYSIVGTGDLLTAATCTGYYATQVAIYEGDCNNLQCVTGNSYGSVFGCGSSSEATWHANAGVMYYIRVFGLFTPMVGDFEVQIYSGSPTA